jgi:hypothetical protein
MERGKEGKKKSMLSSPAKWISRFTLRAKGRAKDYLCDKQATLLRKGAFDLVMPFVLD